MKKDKKKNKKKTCEQLLIFGFSKDVQLYNFPKKVMILIAISPQLSAEVDWWRSAAELFERFFPQKFGSFSVGFQRKRTKKRTIYNPKGPLLRSFRLLLKVKILLRRWCGGPKKSSYL